MNEHVRTITVPIRSVEELARRRWTTAELLALQERGGVVPDLEYELIDGEILAVPSEGPVHQDFRNVLTDDLIRRRPDHLRVDAEPQLNLTDKTHVKPDFVVRPATIRMSALRGPDTLLVIEVADTSLDYDLTIKAALYAAHGVHEYWVINARTLETTVFLKPSPSGYASAAKHPPSAQLVPHLAPELAICLADIKV